MNKFKFDFNQVVKDCISNFQGVVLCKQEYETGCLHYGVVPMKLKDGGLAPWEWVDETRLIPVLDDEGNKTFVKRFEEKEKRVGGPGQNPEMR